MELEEISKFVDYYNQLQLAVNDADCFKACSARRKCLAQLYAASLKLASTETSCMILQDKLQSYIDLVVRSGNGNVNAYAQSAFDYSFLNFGDLADGIDSLEELSSQFTNLLASVGPDSKKTSKECLCYQVQESDLKLLEKEWPVAQSDNGDSVGQSDISMERSCVSDFYITGAESTSLNAKGPKNKQLSQTRMLPTDFPQAVYSPSPRQRGTQQTNSVQWFSQQLKESCVPESNHRVPFDNFPQQFDTGKPDNLCFSRPQAGPSNSHDRDREAVGNGVFRTAMQEMHLQNQKKWNSRGSFNRGGCGIQRKSLGARRGVSSKFIPPFLNSSEDGGRQMQWVDDKKEGPEEEVDERLKNIDPKMVELIMNEIIDHGSPVTWDDIAGLEFAKATIQEIVVWPLLRPDIFTGLRRPPKGLLLFGPPGTGKTLIGKCVASQSRSTFFSISASSLTSKWIGEGEKMVRALFAVARCHQPAIVFIDEIDSLLIQRSNTEHESSRRLKTEFLIQLDGAATGEDDRILIIGATNRPQELDEAARRRLVRRLYIPLPEHKARRQIVERLMSNEQNSLTVEQVEEIAALTAGYSGADMKCLCQEASMGPIRSVGFGDIERISREQVRPVNISDFKSALVRIRPSVSSSDLDIYVEWDRLFGSGTTVSHTLPR